MTRDTVFRIASMTKAVTSVAAMQLVEQGKLTLDDPVPNIDPALGAPQVLEGFDAAGAPILRPAQAADHAPPSADPTPPASATICGTPTRSATSRTPACRRPRPARSPRCGMPLAFDPGERWEYGVNLDWVGILVETFSGQSLDAYFRDHILAPLGMRDTGFVASDAMRARQASVHVRKADGSLAPQPLETPFKPEFYAGGGGLYSTRAHLTFVQMLLHGGTFKGARILKPETVAMMGKNQIGKIEAGVLKTYIPARTNDVDLFHGQSLKWGLGYMINMEPGPNGRSAGSLTWAGIFNTYYWIDPAKRITGVYMTQILPFADPTALKVCGQFESGIYNAARMA
ncbi:MAG: serine hydrolase domain-containing protein [Pseudomonadota bacterium]